MSGHLGEPQAKQDDGDDSYWADPEDSEPRLDDDDDYLDFSGDEAP